LGYKTDSPSSYKTEASRLSYKTEAAELLAGTAQRRRRRTTVQPDVVEERVRRRSFPAAD
jgi:hypothetical protein